MKLKNTFITCFAALLAVSAVAVPVSAAEVPTTVQEDSSHITIEPRIVQKNWKNLSIYTSYKKLPTGNTSEERIANWYGSYATVIFENKTSQDYITLRITDYDTNGRVQKSYERTISGSGGATTVKVTPGSYYTVEAKSTKSLNGVDISTFTER